MLANQPLEDLGEADVLDLAEDCAELARWAEVELLRVAHHWAVLHDPDRLDPCESGLAGRERSRVLGGEGVAAVTEFAAAELGARIGRTTHAARALIADAQDLRHRHPVLWGRVEAGEVRASYARHVVGRTRELSHEEAAHVDAEVAEAADGRIPWTRFEALVEGKVATAAPALAKAKEEQARQARFAKRLRAEGHAMASFMIRADLATITRIDTAVTKLADRLAAVLPEEPAEPDGGDQPATPPRVTVDDRRVKAAVMLLGRELHPEADTEAAPGVQATLIVHLDGRPETPETPQTPRVARVEGHGPVTTDWVRTVLGPHARFTIQPVFDPLGQVPVDAYEIPARHRRATRLLSPADCFPWSSNLSAKTDLDHTTPFDPDGPPGQSRIGNYGPLTRTHHRIKTHTAWSVRQPFPGIYLWRDPHGAHYLVDHTGTRRIDPTSRGTRRRPPPTVIHHHHPHTEIHLDVDDYIAA